MATITTNTYLDGGVTRTAGEAWTINSGATFTVRTDNRWHANAPASMLGSFGSQAINEGKIVYDGSNVRWLSFQSGTGTVPGIGTSITQSGVTSSYLLGVYSSFTAAPTAVGAAMPTTGFIKFREVSGSFVPGALTGIGAEATDADVAGWIEIVADAASTITVPRLGEHEIRGDWFYLDDTNGLVGQVIQIPTNGGGSGTRAAGVWIETSPGSNEYEYWPSLNGATNGWARQHIGGAYGETDQRQNFVKDIGSGQIQIGEASNLSATYANVEVQASTYAIIAHSSTYTWANNLVTITYNTGHLLKTGQQVGLDFTSGGATSYDGLYTVTVIDAFTYTVPLTGSGTAGNVTVRPGLTITFTAHKLGVGDTVYCDFTSGDGVDGDYEIYAVTSANAYLLKYPTAVTVTSGNVSVHSRYEITYTAHGLAVGNRVYLDFTSGAGVDGIYTIIEVPNANTFRIIANNNGAADSGNVTIRQTIGNVPVGLVSNPSDQIFPDANWTDHFRWQSNLWEWTYYAGSTFYNCPVSDGTYGHLLQNGIEAPASSGYHDSSFHEDQIVHDGDDVAIFMTKFSQAMPSGTWGCGMWNAVQPLSDCVWFWAASDLNPSELRGLRAQVIIDAVLVHNEAISGYSLTDWHRFEVRRLSTGAQFYIDGNLVSSYTGTMPSGNMRLEIWNDNAYYDTGYNRLYTPITSDEYSYTQYITHTDYNGGDIVRSGCKVRIPNVFLRECATTTRSVNQVNPTIASRPEWAVTNAGAIDIEYAYSGWYMNFAQSYAAKLHHSCTYDSIVLTECATAINLLDTHTSMFGGLDAVSLLLTSNSAGGTVEDCKFQRGNTPGSSDHAVNISYCKDIEFTNVTGGIIQFARTNGKGLYVSYCNGLTFNNCRSFNSDLPLIQSLNISINDHDHVDRYIGYTNSTTTYYAINIGAGCSNIVADGITFGFGGEVPNVHPYIGIFYSAAALNVKLRNAGTYAAPLACGTWRPNLYALATSHVTGGNNNTVKVQRIYVDNNARSGGFTTINSDKNMTYESIRGGMYVMSAMAVFAQVDAGLNSIIKGCRVTNTTTTGQASVYGTHFRDMFLSDVSGRFILACNEPTAETTQYFTMVSGNQKFNSAGGILMGVIGNQAIWEDRVFRKGHTGFRNSTPTMSGGTIGNYTIEYQIDTGSGYSGTWQTASGANLSAEVIDPSVGFKMKVRITTTTTNTTAITYLRFDTVTTAVAQSSNLYVLDTNTLTITGLQAGSEVRCYTGTDPATAVEIGGVESSGTSFVLTHSSGGVNGYIRIMATGFQEYYMLYTYSESNIELPVSQVLDRNYHA